MTIKSTDRYINAECIDGKKEQLKNWLLANVFTVQNKWQTQKEMFDEIAATPAVADLASIGLVNDAIASLLEEKKIISWDDPFPPEGA